MERPHKGQREEGKTKEEEEEGVEEESDDDEGEEEEGEDDNDNDDRFNVREEDEAAASVSAIVGVFDCIFSLWSVFCVLVSVFGLWVSFSFCSLCLWVSLSDFIFPSH